MDFSNVYDDKQRAEAYSKLEFPGTYYLAYRDLPQIIGGHLIGKRALDFGCGAGRSTRFLQQLGFETVGIDIAKDMLSLARERDPSGDYRLMSERDFPRFESDSFDLILSAFTFDNIPTMEGKVRLFAEFKRILGNNGRIVNLVSAPEIYVNEWVSFSTKDYPENRSARSGDVVRIVITELGDARPVEDIIWSDEDYRTVYSRAGLEILQMHKPLARNDEPYPWVNETRIAPWVIYVLGHAKKEER